MSYGGNQVSSRDLELYKDMIIRLYWCEDRTLREVMHIMKTEHRFHATTRMYKSKFKEWGLAKYLSQQEEHRIRAQIYTGTQMHPRTIHGRVVGSKRFEKALHQDRSMIDAMRRVPTVSSFPTSSHCLQAPTVLYQAESAIHAMHAYTDFCFETLVWELASHEFNDSLERASSWWMCIRRAARLLEQQRDSPDGFRLLHICLDRYGQLLILQDPIFLTATLSAVLQLDAIGRELAESLVRYVVGLSEIKLGLAHPLTVLWSQLRATGVSRAHNLASVALRAHYDSLAHHLEPGPGAITVFQVRGLRQLALFGKTPVKAVEEKFVELLADLEGSDTRSNVDDVLIDFVGATRTKLVEESIKHARAHGSFWVAPERLEDNQNSLIFYQKIRKEITKELSTNPKPAVLGELLQGSTIEKQTEEIYRLTDQLLDVYRHHLFTNNKESAVRCGLRLKRISQYLMAGIKPLAPQLSAKRLKEYNNHGF
ncbi:Clr5 domain-containing protein [Truncatella angustata]|uniref:Clr5 domain-containing protein n=1 Tax=Truncatella angustata TaxID=152316 RepID=A0A9P8RH89_9PEZI|nr:Clr5 domain-containing protein [Truncatella angustata]KAH6645984.1 Clr5 domain-containing protein [Truncatella angustata]